MSTLIIIIFAVAFLLALWLINYYFDNLVGSEEDYLLSKELFFELAVVDIVLWVFLFFLIYVT